MELRRIVVAGGSLAGYSAVSELLGRGYGGELVWVTGDEDFAYSKPALSKEFIQDRVSASGIRLPELPDLPPTFRVLAGRRCTALDTSARVVELDGGERLGFDGLLVCTGATARVPSLVHGIEGVLALRTLDDAQAIKSALAARPRVVVLGGGLIGCELAASVRTLGLDVTVIERLDSLLERAFGATLGDYLRQLHEQHGVRVITGASIDEIRTYRGRITGVVLSDGSALDADLLLVGAGAVPATRWLEGSGLVLSDGVTCDSCLATAIPGIYAAGDIARWLNPLFGMMMRVEHWTSAAAQGRAAVRNLLAWAGLVDGPAVPFADVPYFWSDQYGLKIQMIGWHHGHDRADVGWTGDRHLPMVRFFKEGRLVAAAGVNAARAIMGLRKQIEREATSCSTADDVEVPEGAA